MATFIGYGYDVRFVQRLRLASFYVITTVADTGFVTLNLDETTFPYLRLLRDPGASTPLLLTTYLGCCT